MTEEVFQALSHPATLAPEYRWIRAFDSEQTLQMTAELMSAYRKAARDGCWGEFDALLHEWSESGWAALSPELQEAFASPSDEVQIKNPTSIAE